MSSNAANGDRVVKTNTYLDHSNKPDVDANLIRSHLTCGKFRDSVWGLVVSRLHSPCREHAEAHDIHEKDRLDISLLPLER